MGNVGCFEFRFAMQITNIEQFDNQNGNGYSALNNKKRKRHRRKEKYKRPTFKHRKITKFVGLRNEGATCYMNSMLQTLHHIAALRRNVYKIPVGHEEEQKRKAEQIEKEKKLKEAQQQQTEKQNGYTMSVDDAI